MMTPTNKAIIFDLDNTVINTALRKQKILSSKFNIELPLEEIEKNYSLNKVFRSKEEKDCFFKLLESCEVIDEYNAGLLDDSIPELLEALENMGIQPIFVTGRPNSLKESTLRELNDLKIDIRNFLYMSPDVRITEVLDEHYKESKTVLFKKLHEKYNIIASVGDRPADVKASINNDVPPILLKTTVSEVELSDLRNQFDKDDTLDLIECDDWLDIRNEIMKIVNFDEGLSQLREEFTKNYADWLGDIDSKIKVNISISSIMIALSTTLLTNYSSGLQDKLVYTALIFSSTLSLLFCIRGISARNTSGKKSGSFIKHEFSHWSAILRGKEISSREVEEAKKIRKMPVAKQSKQHLQFFYEKYSTTNIDAIKNIRLYELRKSNHEKAYAERTASNIIFYSIVAIVLYIVFTTFKNNVDISLYLNNIQEKISYLIDTYISKGGELAEVTKTKN
ncbi:HAD family hydrolase [Vibrio parahaemolyticus]|nr:HAD family hydrolase [Vibrio parahaemolyticus]